MNNKAIADRLREISDLLKQQGASVFRVNAYLHAAATVEQLNESLTELVARQGFSALTELPGVGQGIARSIYEYIATGSMSRLESLRSGHDPIVLFEQIPGIGPVLAHRLIEVLHLETLEALATAAHRGQLALVPGFSAGKIEEVQTWLNQVLGYSPSALQKPEPVSEPSVDLLLEIDAVYRKKAAADILPKISPKRFNPGGESWLPVMHASQQSWHFTALYSNTLRAHQLKKTKDWVILYFYDDGHHHEGQHTVVTETKGLLTGKRVVRGRENECLAHYSLVSE